MPAAYIDTRPTPEKSYALAAVAPTNAEFALIVIKDAPGLDVSRNMRSCSPTHRESDRRSGRSSRIIQAAKSVVKALTTEQEDQRPDRGRQIGAKAIAHLRQLKSSRAQVLHHIEGSQRPQQTVHHARACLCRLRDVVERQDTFRSGRRRHPTWLQR